MRRRHVRSVLLAWLAALALVWAAAADGPAAGAVALVGGDGDIIVTDARGVIVGVGRVVAGALFELRLLAGFAGSARLTLLRPDGTTSVLEVVIDGRVRVEGLDLLELLAERVGAFTVEVGGVAHHAAERAGAGSAGAAGANRSTDEPPSPSEAPGRPEAPDPPDPPDPVDRPDAPGQPETPAPTDPVDRPDEPRRPETPGPMDPVDRPDAPGRPETPGPVDPPAAAEPGEPSTTLEYLDPPPPPPPPPDQEY